MSKIIIETVDEIRGDGKATGRKLVRIARPEDVINENKQAMIVLGGKRCGLLLELLEDVGLREVAIGHARKNVAASVEVEKPAATLEWDGDTYALFGTRLIKKMYYRKDNPGKPVYRVVGADCPIRPEHFSGAVNLPAIPEKGKPGRPAGSSATAVLQAEIEKMREEQRKRDEEAARREAMMMEMLMEMRREKASV